MRIHFKLSMLKGFSKGKKGATAVEYGLIVALIAAAIIAALGEVGGSMSNSFLSISDELTNMF